MQIKIMLVILSVIGFGGGAWYVKTLIAENAVLEATLESTTQAMMNYATNAEAEITGYATAVKILGERDSLAREVRDEEFANIESRDLTKMAERKPEMLVGVLSRRTGRLLSALASDRGGSGATADAAANKAGRAEPKAD